MHIIHMEEGSKSIIERQRRLNPNIKEVVKKEIIKLLDAGIIYPISDSVWVSPVQCVPKKSGMTVVENEVGELISKRMADGWRLCIDYQKLNSATRKDHFPLPFIDQMLERIAGMHTTIFCMVIQVTTRFLFFQRTRKKQHLHAHMGLLLIDACLSDCAMHQLLFNDV